MKTANVQPSQVTFNTLMNKTNNYLEGKKILELMKVANIQSNRVTFKTPQYFEKK